MPDPSPPGPRPRIVTRSVPVGSPWRWLARGAEDLRRAPLPGLTGDESLEELKRKKAQLERMAGTLERRASALDAEAKRLGDGR